jgi:glycosyltransferase involved in cell wall biosynthesis
MKISVLIPAHNSAATIQQTIESVLQQTVSPCEILVLDDGSTDRTASIVESLHSSRVTVVQQKQKGIARARDTLCQLAQGDLFAFIDSDDIWHSKYLEVQQSLFDRYPTAGAYFTGHTDFRGSGGHCWNASTADPLAEAELIHPVSFFRRYSRTTGTLIFFIR